MSRPAIKKCPTCGLSVYHHQIENEKCVYCRGLGQAVEDDKSEIDALLDDSYREMGIDWNEDLGEIGAK